MLLRRIIIHMTNLSKTKWLFNRCFLNCVGYCVKVFLCIAFRFREGTNWEMWAALLVENFKVLFISTKNSVWEMQSCENCPGEFKCGLNLQLAQFIDILSKTKRSSLFVYPSHTKKVENDYWSKDSAFWLIWEVRFFNVSVREPSMIHIYIHIIILADTPAHFAC